MLAAATRRTVSAARATGRPLLVAGLRAAAASVRPFAAVSTPDAESHDDFKPKVKASQDDPARLKAQVDQLVKSNKVVLFMKGTPQQPMCGFSMRVVQLLHAHGVDIHGVDILSNTTLRTYMKEYSSWPTFPQLYVDGEFVGGCDIATQMHQNGELGKLLDEKAKAAAGGAGASA